VRESLRADDSREEATRDLRGENRRLQQELDTLRRRLLRESHAHLNIHSQSLSAGAGTAGRMGGGAVGAGVGEAAAGLPGDAGGLRTVRVSKSQVRPLTADQVRHRK
jgi:hypothetical protein